MRIDAHCHFWDPARGDYVWLDAGPPALDPLRRIFSPDDLAALNQKRRVVAVQAAESLAETRYLLDLAAQHPQIAGVVGGGRGGCVSHRRKAQQHPKHVTRHGGSPA